MSYNYSKDLNDEEPVEENIPVNNGPVEGKSTAEPAEQADNYTVEEVRGQYVEQIDGQYVYVEEYANPYRYTGPAPS